MCAEEQLHQRYRMQAEGSDVEKLIEGVAALMEMPSGEIIIPGKDKKRTKARSMLGYWATDRLGIMARNKAAFFQFHLPGSCPFSE